MQLIENPDVLGKGPEDVLVLVRHGIDVSELSQELNQPLTEETKPDIRNLAVQIIGYCGTTGIMKVRLSYSNRLRTIQTASIIAQELFGSGISVEMKETDMLREVRQGKFLIKDHREGTEYKPLVNAWKAWQKELDDSEMLYRFGDPKMDPKGVPKYPDIAGWFSEFGEHQGDFSLRIYRFLSQIYSDTGPHLNIAVAHQATCSRIQRISSSISVFEDAHAHDPGYFVRYLEKRGSRQPIGFASGIVISKPPKSRSALVLQKEISYLNMITKSL
ncbi:MAG TPA: histidine phosphatase family protein [Candidatus Paceibacterota bacterium]